MYSFNIVEAGITYTVYFFATFTGHFHPFTPSDPLEFNEIFQPLVKYDSSSYYQGWYRETPSGPRLDKLIKYRLMRTPFKGEFELSAMPGVYYRRLEKVESEWLAREIISPEIVLKQTHYLRYSINDDGKLENAYHVYSMVWDSYFYTYHDNGTLKDTEITVNDTPDEIPDL